MKSAEEMRAALAKVGGGGGGGAFQAPPNTTGSPALAAQPPSITGQGPTLPSSETSSSALPPGGNAQVGGAPLSSNEAPESRGGADEPNSQIDLTPDRGNGTAFQLKLMLGAKSDGTYEQTKKSMIKVMHNLGKDSKDPEMSKLLAGRMADNWGMTADKNGDAVQKQVLDKQIQQFDTVVDIDVQNGEITNTEGEKRKKKYRGVFAGMSREQFSAFLWDWGASMMANGKEGWGAVGQAGSDAMGAHRGRIKADQEQERVDTETLRKGGLEERAQLADTMRAEASMKTADAAGTKNAPGIQWSQEGAFILIPDPDNPGKFKQQKLYDVLTGDQIQAGMTPGQGNKEYRDQWMMKELVKAGYTHRDSLNMINGQATEGEMRFAFTKIWAASEDRETMYSPLTGKKKKKGEFTEPEKKAWIDSQIASSSPRPALAGQGDPEKDAVDKHAE